MLSRVALDLPAEQKAVPFTDEQLASVATELQKKLVTTVRGARWDKCRLFNAANGDVDIVIPLAQVLAHVELSELQKDMNAFKGVIPEILAPLKLGRIQELYIGVPLNRDEVPDSRLVMTLTVGRGS